jgi:hypothetical protein
MKRFFVCLIIFAFVIPPVCSKAMMVVPPPSCDTYENGVIAGNTYHEIGYPKFENGFLALHFVFNAPTDQRDFSFYSIFLAHDNCAYIDKFSSTVTIPESVNSFSLRFNSNNSFSFYDDSSNLPLTCAGCSKAFTSDPNNNYKIQIFFSNDYNNDYVHLQALDVTEPKPVGKTPLLIIPGTLGTEIWKQTEKLWPDVDRMTSITQPSDAFMDPMAFKSDGTPLDTSLSLGEVVGKPRAEFDYSDLLVQDLISSGYVKDQNLFFFPYDWRDDIEKNSENFLKTKVAELASSSPTGTIDIVAHSQGGLLIKRLLFDHPDYQAKVGKLIFVGTPNLGAPKAAKALLFGDSFGVEKWRIGLDPLEMKKIGQNMPAVYQLLPSQAYFDHNPYLSEIDNGIRKNYTTYEQSTAALKKSIYQLNSGLIDSANTFHTQNFDNMDFSNSGIDSYNIMGCESPTIGHILANDTGSDLDLDYVPGDGTVPLFSASNINGAHNFYVLSQDTMHGTMLTHDGIRQKIVNILNNKQALVTDITSNPALCVFEGNKVSVHSPVNMDIYDELGQHVGLNANRTLDEQIGGVQYDILGHEKFAFLPVGHTYTIKLTATDKGTFDFYSEKVEGETTLSTAYYNAIPITTTSTAETIINNQNNQTINFTSDGRVVPPSAVLDQNSSLDQTPPVSTSTLTGTMGNPGFYRTDVKINISVQDPVINNNASTTSGILKTQYSLDGGVWQSLTSPPSLPPEGGGMGTIALTSEGRHTISFFSTDKAGNNEQVQTITFTIDKTAPEAVIQFSPTQKDIQFTGTDNISTTSKVTVLDNINDITLTDQAGNVTDIKLKEKNRKVSMQSTIQSLSYNTVAQDVSKNTLAFLWTYDKSGNLTMLSQNVAARKTYVILAIYNGKKTSLVGIDKTGIILKSVTGLDLLKVTTSKGDLAWGY